MTTEPDQLPLPAAQEPPALAKPPKTRRRDAAGRRHRSLALAITLDVVLLVVLLGSWQFAVDSGSVSGLLYGSPGQIWHTIVGGVESGTMFSDAGATALEALLGFVIGNLIGATIGVALWYSRLVEQMLRPAIAFLGATPVAALAPMIIVWVGTGMISKIVVSAASVVVTALVLAFQGARGTDPLQIRLLRSMGAPTRRVFRLLVLPSSLVNICGGLRLTAGLALVGAIIGEFISSSSGLGHAILIAGSLYDISTVLANLLVVGLLALVLLGAIGRVERVILRWRFLALSE
ncbi:MAG TPA: ABC transporter permease [Amycolatopsis sp.]|jgi:NitT/TauT family transport system permease protein|nr:ABC transporter permease [Amycolatopsis sp.]